MSIERAIRALAMINAILEVEELEERDKLKAIRMVMAILKRNM